MNNTFSTGDRCEHTVTGQLGEVTGFSNYKVLVRFDDGAELLISRRHLSPVLSDFEMRNEKREQRRRHFAVKRSQTED